MPDKTSRFKCKGQTLLHFMGCSTFSQYTVVSKYSVVAITNKAPLDKACLLGCGLTTGYGAACVPLLPASRLVLTVANCRTKTANVKEGETTAVFGLGAVGLAVVQGAVARKASRVIAIDTNDGKEAWAKKMGATDFINPTKLNGKSIVDTLVEMTDGGLDHTL
jgi:S-(hydroxymethyl)glutathione dehydrogenase/alcohol dehydrogenase